MGSRPYMSARLDELFRTCDTKGRGVIGPTEFRELCRSFGISDNDSDAIFNDLDHDGDGQIDFEDFSYGFRDFLTPGSRRGSLQIPMVLPVEGQTANEGCDGVDKVQAYKTYNYQLEEMERKHAEAKSAWKQFTNNVGIGVNVKPFVPPNGDLYEVVEEIRSENGEVSTKLEKALSSLISDVSRLHDEYKSLETSFRKEREVHAAQLAALGEELDHQLAKTEAKAKAEAREEAQKQMDTERKKIATEMEMQMADLSAQLMTFKKVEEWLSEESMREKKSRIPEDSSKLVAAESENRSLRSALVEAQMKATLLQTQLTQKRNECIDLYQDFHTEKVAASEYRNQVDLMQNHLSVLSQANRVLSDANDCFSMAVPMPHMSLSGPNSGPNSLPCNSFHSEDFSHSHENPRPHSDINLYSGSGVSRGGSGSGSDRGKFEDNNNTTGQGQGFSVATDNDKDSGRGTLLEELRAEGDGSPLPSGVWSSTPSPHESPPSTNKNSAISPSNSQAKTSSMSTPNPPFSKNSSDAPNATKKKQGNTYKSFMDLEDETMGQNGMGIGMDHRTSEPRLLMPQRTFKVILAGDAAVGKTTFIERVCHGHFTPNLSSTIGVDFRVKSVQLDGQPVALQLWDTAGQERFRSLTKSYFRRADGVILMYDVTNERTFLSIRHWMQNVEEGAGRKVPIVLCGNKSDLRDSFRDQGSVSFCIRSEDGAKLAASCGALFVETSPKTGYNVLEALVILAREMSLVEDQELKNSVKLECDDLDGSNKKRGCCGGSSAAPNTSNKFSC